MTSCSNSSDTRRANDRFNFRSEKNRFTLLTSRKYVEWHTSDIRNLRHTDSPSNRPGCLHKWPAVTTAPTPPLYREWTMSEILKNVHSHLWKVLWSLVVCIPRKGKYIFYTLDLSLDPFEAWNAKKCQRRVDFRYLNVLDIQMTKRTQTIEMREKNRKNFVWKTGKLTNDLKQHEPQYLIVNILL